MVPFLTCSCDWTKCTLLGEILDGVGLLGICICSTLHPKTQKRARAAHCRSHTARNPWNMAKPVVQRCANAAKSQNTAHRLHNDILFTLRKDTDQN
eukprot:4304916-Amphidinium_carterae.3